MGRMPIVMDMETLKYYRLQRGDLSHLTDNRLIELYVTIQGHKKHLVETKSDDAIAIDYLELNGDLFEEVFTARLTGRINHLRNTLNSATAQEFTVN